MNIKGGGPTYYTQEEGGMKTVLYLPDIESYGMNMSTAVLSYYKLVSSSSTRFILLNSVL